MTTTVIPVPAARIAAVGMRATRRWQPRRADPLAGISPSDRSTPVTTLLARPAWIEDEAGAIAFPLSAPGVIGGAVIRAARRSAGSSRQDLARMLAVSPRTVRTWENGTHPLFSVRYDQLCQIANALRNAGAGVGQEVAELVLASQCDLLIAGILRGSEDYAEVPPIEDPQGETPRSLLRWALTGSA